MGANLCTQCHIIPCQKSKSSRARKVSPLKEGIQHKYVEIENQRRLPKIFKRKIDLETQEKKILMPRKLTLHDWLLASPSLKPEYLMRGELSVHSMKKVHPCSGQFLGSLLSEAKDSLCLDRPINHHEESEDMSNCSSKDMSNCSLISKSLSRKSQKSVTFKLPHTVIYYTPEETYSKKASFSSSQEQKLYYKGQSESEDSFFSPMEHNWRENSFDSCADEPVFRLAVDILPHVFVSSKV